MSAFNRIPNRIAVVAIAIAATTALLPTDASAFSFGGHGFGGFGRMGRGMTGMPMGHSMMSMGHSMPAFGHSMPALGRAPELTRGMGVSNLRTTSFARTGTLSHEALKAPTREASIASTSRTDRTGDFAKRSSHDASHTGGDTPVANGDRSSSWPVARRGRSDALRSDPPVGDKIDRVGDSPVGGDVETEHHFRDLLGGGRDAIVDAGALGWIHVWCRNDKQIGVVCHDPYNNVIISMVEDNKGNLHLVPPPPKKPQGPSFISLYDPATGMTTTRTFNPDGTHTDTPVLGDQVSGR